MAGDAAFALGRAGRSLLALARRTVVFLLGRVRMALAILSRHKPSRFCAAVVRRPFGLSHLFSPTISAEMRCERAPPLEKRQAP